MWPSPLTRILALAILADDDPIERGAFGGFDGSWDTGEEDDGAAVDCGRELTGALKERGGGGCIYRIAGISGAWEEGVPTVKHDLAPKLIKMSRYELDAGW